LKAVHFTQEQVEEANGPGYWQMETGVEPARTNGWLAFIDPFHLDSEAWLRTWNEAYAPVPVLGGLASGDFNEQVTQVYLNGEVFEAGGVAISVGGEVKLASMTSQGCTPIGQTWTLTKVEHNVIHKIGNRPLTRFWRKLLTPSHRTNKRRRAATCSSAWWSTNTWMNFIAAIS